MTEPARDPLAGRAAATTTPRAPGAGDRVARLWLETLGDVAARAAHELKGALNGAAVSLEVVRVRSAKAGVAPGAIEPFAASAARQLELLTARTEALLALTRPTPEPVDVALLLSRLVTLLAPAAESHGGAVVLEADGDEALSAAPGPVVRLVLAAVLTGAMSGAGRVTCHLEIGRAVRVRVRRDGAAPPPLRPDIVHEAAGADVRVERAEDELTVVLPAYAAGAGPGRP